MAVILGEHGILETDKIGGPELRQRHDASQAASVEEVQRVACVDGHPSVVEARGV
jgi:hypothetical protein